MISNLDPRPYAFPSHVQNRPIVSFSSFLRHAMRCSTVECERG